MRILVALVSLWLAGRLPAQADESCRTCHPDVKLEHEASIHGHEFGCVDCHGGDPAVMSEAAHATAKKFVGKPSRAAVPALCATCHADPNRMKPFGLSTDQYAQYITSGHGRRLAQGDTRVAICTDCHGVHRIVSRAEPTSPVAARNIAATCGRCHSDAALMAEYKLPADQVEKFRRSVHGAALYDDGHPSAPTCATCHGKHGAIALHGGASGTTCGHCHSRTREYFNESPHKKAAEAGKMSECVSCHGYHDTPPPDHSLFDRVCQQCHATDSKEFVIGQKIKTVLTQAEAELRSAVTEMKHMEVQSPSVARFQSRLQQAWAHQMEALPVQHTLQTERVDDLARKARSLTLDVQSSLHGVKEDLHMRYLVLALAWIFILFAVGVAYLYGRERRRLRHEHRGAGGAV